MVSPKRLLGQAARQPSQGKVPLRRVVVQLLQANGGQDERFGVGLAMHHNSGFQISGARRSA
jgi:hypothetical protein